MTSPEQKAKDLRKMVSQQLFSSGNNMAARLVQGVNVIAANKLELTAALQLAMLGLVSHLSLLFNDQDKETAEAAKGIILVQVNAWREQLGMDPLE